jgi:2-oxoglutarate/2-oxoacid ferredoxin oxidoreductase subunit beta
VAQGTPADLPGLTALLEQAIRFPGFSFVNVQSPCVTYGEDDQQIKAQKAKMKTLDSLGHDPSDRIRAMDRAQHYGRELYTGVFYRNPSPPPTFDALVGERQQQLSGKGLPRERILDLFLQR